MSRPAEDAAAPDPYNDGEFHRTKRAARSQEGRQSTAATINRTKGNNEEFIDVPEGPRPSRGSRQSRPPYRERTLVSIVSQREKGQRSDGAGAPRPASHKEFASVVQETGYLGKYREPSDNRQQQGFAGSFAKPGYFEDEYAPDGDGSLCSEDERDVEMLKRKRRARERRNLPIEELHYGLENAETEKEQRALANEVDRRRHVSRLIKFAGGDGSSEKNTRDALVDAGWARRR